MKWGKVVLAMGVDLNISNNNEFSMARIKSCLQNFSWVLIKTCKIFCERFCDANRRIFQAIALDILTKGEKKFSNSSFGPG
jgi:hypothetical protein